MRYRLHANAASLSGRQNHRIADVVRTNLTVPPLDSGNGCRRANPQITDRLVGAFKTIQNQRPQRQPRVPTGKN